MSLRRAGHRRFRTIALAVMVIAVGGAVAAALMSPSRIATAGGEATQPGPIPQAGRNTGPSGLPLPRFVSLKTDRVNVRRGPSTAHQVAWVFARKGLPVEIIAESDHWRRVRDSEGEEGWVYHSLLTGHRTVLVAPWRQGDELELLGRPGDDAALIARLQPGVVGRVLDCTGDWCQIAVSDYEGWIQQAMLWGVYPGERVD